MHLLIQRMAVWAPIGAEDEHDIPFAPPRVRHRRSNVAAGIRLLVIDGSGGSGGSGGGLFSAATQEEE
jgi:hypothetical protein